MDGGITNVFVMLYNSLRKKDMKSKIYTTCFFNKFYYHLSKSKLSYSLQKNVM